MVEAVVGRCGVWYGKKRGSQMDRKVNNGENMTLAAGKS